MKRSIELAGGVLEAVEFVVFACAAVAFVAVGPVIWIHRLWTADRFAWAITLTTLWVVSVAVIGREIRRRAVTLVSFSIFLGWLVTLVWRFYA